MFEKDFDTFIDILHTFMDFNKKNDIIKQDTFKKCNYRIISTFDEHYSVFEMSFFKYHNYNLKRKKLFSLFYEMFYDSV